MGFIPLRIEVPVLFRNPIHQSKHPLQLWNSGEKQIIYSMGIFHTAYGLKTCDGPKPNVRQMSHRDSFGCVIFKICATMAQKRSLGRTLTLLVLNNQAQKVKLECFVLLQSLVEGRHRYCFSSRVSSKLSSVLHLACTLWFIYFAECV